MAMGKRPDEAVLRQWVRDRIVITPFTKRGIVAVNAVAYDTCRYKQNDRPEGRSCVNMVAGAGFEPATFGL
jgi:hypothetical protein